MRNLTSSSLPLLHPLCIAAAPFPLIVDAIFGFSFDPNNGIREPYRAIIDVISRHKLLRAQAVRRLFSFAHLDPVAFVFPVSL